MRKSEARGERGLAMRDGGRGDPAGAHEAGGRATSESTPSSCGVQEDPRPPAAVPSFPLSSPEDSRIPQGRWPRLRGLPGRETWVHRTPRAAAPPLDSAPREPPAMRRRGRRDLTPSGWAESREGARAPGGRTAAGAPPLTCAGRGGRSAGGQRGGCGAAVSPGPTGLKRAARARHERGGRGGAEGRSHGGHGGGAL